MGSSTSLTVGEAKQLATYEERIQGGITAFVDVGQALAAIRDKRLYSDFGTFEEYCKRRWSFSRQRAHQLIESAKVIDVVSTVVDTPPPDNERQTRELAKLDSPQKQADAWVKAVESAPKDEDGKPKVTAKHVAEAVKEVSQPKPEPKPADKPKEPEPLLDGNKQPIPAKLKSLFERGKEFDDLCRQLHAVSTAIEKLCGEPLGAHLHCQTVTADIDNAKRALRFGKPFAVCPYCKAKNPEKCSACKGHGWVGKNLFKSAPEEMKA